MGARDHALARAGGPWTPGCPSPGAPCWCSTPSRRRRRRRGGCGSSTRTTPTSPRSAPRSTSRFGAAGTASGPQSVAERDAAVAADQHLAGRDARGDPRRALGPGRGVRRHGRAGGRRQPQPPWRRERDRRCRSAAGVPAARAGRCGHRAAGTRTPRSGASARCSARPSPRTWPGSTRASASGASAPPASPRSTERQRRLVGQGAGCAPICDTHSAAASMACSGPPTR